MTGRLYPLVLSAVFSWGLSAGLAADELINQARDPLCGAKCLYTGLVALELDPGSYSTFIENCGDVEARGFSLGQLDEFAKQHGATTLAVQTTFENLKLRRERFVCIAHVDGNHFVNVGDVNDNSVWVINPPQEGSMALELFAKRWNGQALLLARSALVPEEELQQPWRWGWAIVGGLMAAGIAAAGIIRKRSLA